MKLKATFIRVSLTFGLIVIIIAVIVGTALLRGGALRSAQDISPGQCIALPIELGSAEDIEVDKETGTVFLSVLDRRGIVQGVPVRGDILSFSMESAERSVSSVLKQVPDVFRPHGMSYHRNRRGQESLFVINHSPIEGEKIEIFTRQPGNEKFLHIESLTDPTLIEPNDIVAVGKHQFYVANDSGASNALERAAEMLFAAGMSPLVYYDGSEFSIVADDLRSSGGISANLARNELYVSETVGKAIRIYRLEETGMIGPVLDTIELEGGPDNISIGALGDILVANHINTLALVKHFGDKTQPAPTQIQKLKYTQGYPVTPQTIYENDGRVISAGSVGVVYSSKLAIGSITENKVLLCDLSPDNGL